MYLYGIGIGLLYGYVQANYEDNINTVKFEKVENHFFLLLSFRFRLKSIFGNFRLSCNPIDSAYR